MCYTSYPTLSFIPTFLRKEITGSPIKKGYSRRLHSTKTVASSLTCFVPIKIRPQPGAACIWQKIILPANWLPNGGIKHSPLHGLSVKMRPYIFPKTQAVFSSELLRSPNRKTRPFWLRIARMYRYGAGMKRYNTRNSPLTKQPIWNDLIQPSTTSVPDAFSNWQQKNFQLCRQPMRGMPYGRFSPPQDLTAHKACGPHASFMISTWSTWKPGNAGRSRRKALPTCVSPQKENTHTGIRIKIVPGIPVRWPTAKNTAWQLRRHLPPGTKITMSPTILHPTE